MEFELINNIYLKTEKKQSYWDELSYTKKVWLDSPYGKKPKEKTLSFFDKRSGKFLAGFAPRFGFILPKIKPSNMPILESVDFRDFQKELILKAIQKQRGVILAPTAAGKTIIAMGIISCFKKETVNVIVPSVDLLQQTAKELKKYWPGQVAMLGDGIDETNKKHKILISIIDSFANKNNQLQYDITIIDECHNCNSISKKKNKKNQKKISRYGEVMLNCQSVMKIGLTATLPTEKENLMTLEGLIGSVIGEYAMQDGVNEGFLAKPTIDLIPIKKVEISKHKSYSEIRNFCIINNEERNQKIIDKTLQKVNKNKTCLIICNEIEHSNLLFDLLQETKIKNKVFVAQGSTKGTQRLEIKQALETKKAKVVICTIWKEGVNITSLDNVILALGGKSSIKILQSIGRGMRITKTKKVMTVIDFIDSSFYMAEHFAERMKIYIEKGWLK